MTGANSSQYFIWRLHQSYESLAQSFAEIKRLGRVETLSERREREFSSKGYSLNVIEGAHYCARRHWLQLMAFTIHSFVERQSKATFWAAKAFSHVTHPGDPSWIPMLKIQIYDLSIESATDAVMGTWEALKKEIPWRYVKPKERPAFFKAKLLAEERLAAYGQAHAAVERLVDLADELESIAVAGLVNTRSQELVRKLKLSMEDPHCDAAMAFDLVSEKLHELQNEANEHIGDIELEKALSATLRKYQLLLSSLESDVMLLSVE